MQAIKRTLNMNNGFFAFKNIKVTNFSDYVIFRRIFFNF